MGRGASASGTAGERRAAADHEHDARRPVRGDRDARTRRPRPTSTATNASPTGSGSPAPTRWPQSSARAASRPATSSPSRWRRASTTPSRTRRARGLGAVATGINTRLGPGEVSAILHRCEPVALLHDGDRRPRFPADAPAPAVLMPRAEVAAAWQAGTPLPDRPVRHPEDPVCIVWTSGTTGLPKGAWFDHRALEASARLSDILSAYHDVRLMPVPFPHAGYMNKLWDQVEFVINCVLTATPVDGGVDARADGRRARDHGLGRAHAVGEARRPPAAAPTPTSRRCGSARPARRRSRPSWPRRCARASAARSWSATRARSRRRSPAPAPTTRPRCCCTPSAGRRRASSSSWSTPTAHDGRAAARSAIVTLRSPCSMTRVLERSRAHRRDALARRLDHHQRPRPAARRRQPRAARPDQRDVHPGRVQHSPARGGARARRPPEDRTGRDRRHARADHRRDRRGVRRAARSRRIHRPWTSCATSCASGSADYKAPDRLEIVAELPDDVDAQDRQAGTAATAQLSRPERRRPPPRRRGRGSAGSPARRRCGSTPASRPG